MINSIDEFYTDPVFAWAYERIHLRYSEDQPRDDHGRFGEGSGDSSSSSESKGGTKESEKVPQGTPVMPGHQSMKGKTPGTLTDDDINTMADTITARYDSCSQEMKDAGAAWYPDAHDLIADVAAENGFTEDQGIAIAAALSPGTRWEPDNVMQAIQFMSKYGDSPNANPELELNFWGARRTPTSNAPRVSCIPSIP